MDRLQQLTVFRRVAETGNITRAARDLGLSQPSVSRIVGELEQRLGVPLLLRSPRGLATTDAGASLHLDAVRILDAIDEAEASARGSQAAVEGSLRIAAAAALFNRLVMPWLPAFLDAHPRLIFDARLDSRIADLVDEGIDLAIRVGTLADQTLMARRVGGLQIALYASPSYVARHGTPDTPGDLARHCLCTPLLARQPGALRLVGAGGETVDVETEVRLRSTDMDTVRLATEAGCGIGVMAMLSAKDAEDAGRLVRVLPAWQGPARDIHAVWPGTRTLPRRVRLFLDMLVATTARDPCLGGGGRANGGAGAVDGAGASPARGA